MKLRKYSESDLRLACANSLSKREVLQKLNVIAAGGNYATLTKSIKHFSIDISHFKGRAWNRGKTLGPKRDVSEYLSNSQTIQSHKLRIRLLEEGIFEHRCMKCQRTEWNELSIPLELEHKDGDHSNNKLDNLQLLCPNCHAQTPTYRGKNINKPLSSALPPPEVSPN